MKGIILAGGSGTRLYPATLAVCKQLLPIYDKPMIYYPLSILLLAKIKDILIISTPDDTPRFEKLFGDGSRLGIHISYKIQEKPQGIAQAFLLAKDFIGHHSVALILGDNLFYGPRLQSFLEEGVKIKSGGMIFGYQVKDPNRYGVVEFDAQMNVIGIEEKPKIPKSSYAVPGLYFYGSEVVEMAASLKPSARGELEITDINQMYLKKHALKVQLLTRGYAWLDTGTFDAFQKASLFVQTIQERQGLKIACIEEIAYKNKYITKEELIEMSQHYHNEYGEYLRQIALEVF